MKLFTNKFTSVRALWEACSGNLECWEPSQHLLIDIGKPRKTCVEMLGRRTFWILTYSQQSGMWSKKSSTHKSIIKLYKSDSTQRCGLSQTKLQETSQYFSRPISRKTKKCQSPKTEFPIKTNQRFQKLSTSTQLSTATVPIALKCIISVCTLWTTEGETLYGGKFGGLHVAKQEG
jgi:hypothetical protein